MDEAKLSRIQGYLDGVARVNSVCTCSDLWCDFSFNKICREKNIICCNKHFVINKVEGKIFKGYLGRIDNWEEELRRSCLHWFHLSAINLALNVMSYEMLKEHGKDAHEIIKNKIRDRDFDVSEFIKLLKEFFSAHKVHAYAYSNPYFKPTKDPIDKFFYIVQDQIYTLHFEYTD